MLWRLAGDDRWGTGEAITFPSSRGPYEPGPDGSGMLEILLDDVVDRYVEFAGDYYEMEVDRSAVEHVVAHRPLSDAVVRALNPHATVAALQRDVAAIGYPVTVM